MTKIIETNPYSSLIASTVNGDISFSSSKTKGGKSLFLNNNVNGISGNIFLRDDLVSGRCQNKMPKMSLTVKLDSGNVGTSVALFDAGNLGGRFNLTSNYSDFDLNSIQELGGMHYRDLINHMNAMNTILSLDDECGLFKNAFTNLFLKKSDLPKSIWYSYKCY